jgi:hypothetical protein
MHIHSSIVADDEAVAMAGLRARVTKPLDRPWRVEEVRDDWRQFELAPGIADVQLSIARGHGVERVQLITVESARVRLQLLERRPCPLPCEEFLEVFNLQTQRIAGVVVKNRGDVFIDLSVLSAQGHHRNADNREDEPQPLHVFAQTVKNVCAWI